MAKALTNSRFAAVTKKKKENSYELRIGRTSCDVELFNYDFIYVAGAASWLAPSNIEILKEWKMEPKVTDRVDAVSEAGASEMMREVNI